MWAEVSGMQMHRIELGLVAVLQHTATHCDTLQHTKLLWEAAQPSQYTIMHRVEIAVGCYIEVHSHVGRDAATHCNTLQQTADHLVEIGIGHCFEAHPHVGCDTAAHCNTLQHTATLCNTLQESATHRVEIGIGNYFQAHAHIGRESVQSAVYIFGVQLHSYILRLVRKGDVKRDIYVSKMSNICRKRPIYVKRDLHMSKKTFKCQMRATSVKRDLHISKGTYLCQKRPT